MAIKHVVTFGFGQGGAPFLPTLGFSVGAVRNWLWTVSAPVGKWLADGVRGKWLAGSPQE